MIKWSAYCLFLLPLFGSAQLDLEVNLTIGEQSISLNRNVIFNDHSFQLEQARIYLSKFEFYQNNQLVAVDPTEAYLVDFEIDSTRKLFFPDINSSEVDEIRFLFGIDSITNTSGAMSGALDPMYGMYWSWQSGYINCKLEGRFSAPGQELFQLHLGGYAQPFQNAQLIILDNSKTKTTRLNIDLRDLIYEMIQQKSDLHVMSPCAKAVDYAKLLTKSIELKP